MRRDRNAPSFDLGALPPSSWTKPPLTVQRPVLPPSVSRVNRERLIIGGQSVKADRIRVRGTLAADLWCDASWRWVEFEFSARRIQDRQF